eukprot:410425-Hanusia_phi.AAC.1
MDILGRRLSQCRIRTLHRVPGLAIRSVSPGTAQVTPAESERVIPARPGPPGRAGPRRRAGPDSEDPISRPC